jgi:lysyl-tRNA synthetase, class II
MQAARTSNCDNIAGSTAAKVEVEAEMDPTAYYQNRLAMVESQKGEGINPYPHKFHVDYTLPEFIEKFKEQVTPGEQMAEEVAVAGRIHSKRPSGAKLVFYDLIGNGQKIQIMASQNVSENEADGEAFISLHNSIKRGDIVGVVGKPGASKNGELSIFPRRLKVQCRFFVAQHATLTTEHGNYSSLQSARACSRA